MTNVRRYRWSVCLLVFLALGLPRAVARAQDAPSPPSILPSKAEPAEEATPEVPKNVDVQPLAGDQEIAARLGRILEATGWFYGSEVRVDEGVAFLSGQADTAEHRTWAGKLASNTQDVVAVVNQIDVIEPSVWDMSSTWRDLRGLFGEIIHALPLLGLAVTLLVLTWYGALGAMRTGRYLLKRRMQNSLLRQVISNALAVPVFLAGLYLVLRVSGLTQLALTVIGGTGLMGLVIGFAFRDIAENFLASILISMQRPFQVGDRIAVADADGFVQKVTLRGTILMTLDGNHVQIPNATVYKNTIRNYTANPNVRLEFVVGIGYDASIPQAQEIAMRVLADHPAVLADPEPTVLAESLGAATVNLRVYFWTNIQQYGGLKVLSAVIRQVKNEFQAAHISLPDTSREIVFPEGVPLRRLPQAERPSNGRPAPPRSPTPHPEERRDVTAAEGNLQSEAQEIEQQARQSRPLEEGADLLKTDAAT